MNSRRIRRKYAKMMSELTDQELLSCIYMLCSTLIRRSDYTITLEDILTSIWNIGKLVDHYRGGYTHTTKSCAESEDKDADGTTI